MENRVAYAVPIRSLREMIVFRRQSCGGGDIWHFPLQH